MGSARAVLGRRVRSGDGPNLQREYSGQPGTPRDPPRGSAHARTQRQKHTDTHRAVLGDTPKPGPARRAPAGCLLNESRGTRPGDATQEPKVEYFTSNTENAEADGREGGVKMLQGGENDIQRKQAASATPSLVISAKKRHQ